MRILLVEDHEDTASAMARLLQLHAHHVTRASTAADACAAVRQSPFDLILCDLSLPDEDGWSLLPRLRSHSSAPAIAMSGRARREDIQHSLSAGFHSHLSKPISFDAILQAINAAAPAASPA